ncbi:murein L,D-transpeptidase YcbB/YkuD [Hoeflea marina]|uniref:Murein L,D-transpeptidase YcbB/YkuD n=1 Tax=Hoeflea marina TaxID=274592 RepID=A0A317PU77_9HYPH|nr:L,D-transpeptidase family protein [Hoeflea marina]PWW04487.1 murein L,D-transpeptidase YcbB/YkuD [Hoeflea marina]
MKLKMRSGVALLAVIVCATTAAVPVRPAQARGLLEAIFQPNRESQRQAMQRQREAEAQRAAQEQQVSRPVARVSGPTYNTYRADKLTQVNFSKISDPVVTGAVNDMGLPQLGMDPFAEGRAALDDLALRALPEVADAVISHYSSHPGYLWVAGTGITESARAVLTVLADADSVGLSAQDYAVVLPSDGFDATQGTARQQELMRFEMSLSVAAASYMLDATRGRIDPNRISGYHDFKRKDPDLARGLAALGAAADPVAALLAYNPQGPHFTAFVEELKRLQSLDEGQHVAIADGLLLKPGQSDPELANVMAAIKLKGSDSLKAGHALVLASYAGNPEYDSELVALVKDFQKENGLSADGVIGSNTVRALVGVTNADKIEKVRVAMEQSRWLPSELGARRVFINQPAYTATYYDQGRPELSMRVVVGSKAHQTNFFQDEIETVEVNPYWGVPQSILINEMLPKLRNDASYLDRLGYEVVENGRPVSSTMVNWHQVGKGSRIDIRQPPSGDNALGELKILFPNTHAIYMHDTPSKSLFNKDMRAYSHGCIRLQDPRAMAAKVLGTTVEEVGREIAGGQNKAIPTPSKIPVYVAYFTAWPDETGAVQYFADVYGRDAYTEKAIAATVAERAPQV